MAEAERDDKGSRDRADGRGTGILRGRGHVSAEHGGDERAGRRAAGAGGAGWGGFRLSGLARAAAAERVRIFRRNIRIFRH